MIEMNCLLICMRLIHLYFTHPTCCFCFRDIYLIKMFSLFQWPKGAKIDTGFTVALTINHLTWILDCFSFHLYISPFLYNYVGQSSCLEFHLCLKTSIIRAIGVRETQETQCCTSISLKHAECICIGQKSLYHLTLHVKRLKRCSI